MTDKYPPRPRGGFWNNAKPITDIHQALDMLRPGDSDSTDGRYLDMTEDPPELQVGWFHDGDSGGASSGLYYYQIDPAVTKALQEEKLVEPKRVPCWGSTETRFNELVLSKLGEQKLNEYVEKLRDIARGLVIPGKHTKFSGVLNACGYGPCGRFYSEFYFDFVTPMNEHLRVYPASKRVEPRT